LRDASLSRAGEGDLREGSLAMMVGGDGSGSHVDVSSSAALDCLVAFVRTSSSVFVIALP